MTTKARRLLILGAVAATILAAGGVLRSHAGEWTGDVSFILGVKALDESDWEPVDQQAEFAAAVSWGKKDWPVRIATDLVGTAQEKNISQFDPEFGFFSGDLTGSTSELAFGVRKVWTVGNARPFVGGGLAFIRGEIKFSVSGFDVSQSDTAVGPWIDGGAFWRLGKRFDIGVEARISRAKIEPVSGIEMEAGGSHLGLILGFGW